LLTSQLRFYWGHGQRAVLIEVDGPRDRELVMALAETE
jgi:hypothetical protein